MAYIKKTDRKTRSDKGKQRVSREYHVLTFRMDDDLYKWVVRNKGEESIMRFVSNIIRKEAQL